MLFFKKKMETRPRIGPQNQPRENRNKMKLRQEVLTDQISQERRVEKYTV